MIFNRILRFIGAVGLIAMVLSFACTRGEALEANGTAPTALQTAKQQVAQKSGTMTPAKAPAKGPSTATASPDRTASPPGQRVKVSGVLNVMWGDPPPESGQPPRMRYILSDKQGRNWTLVFDKNVYWPPGGLRVFDRKQVAVEGKLLPGGETTWIVVDSIKLE